MGSAKSRSENVEMYLETIYLLTERGERARTQAVAHGWKVAPSSATEMLQRLAGEGLLRYEPYHGVELTARGRAIGEKIVRRHRLLELFLTREVGMTARPAGDFACHMEHVIPDELEAWVCRALRHPRATAAGESIPRGDCCPPRRPA
ncbi:MAG: metal-dependent transcriptional regulator [Thermoplasmatota archaeon]